MTTQSINFSASQVNKEFREKLVTGARKKLNSTKDELRWVQNAHTKRMEESDPPPGVSKDDVCWEAEVCSSE